MGGSHSEPGTMVDVGHFVRELHSTPGIFESSGFKVGDYTLEQVLQAIQHVDDILFMSQIWCHTCVERKVKQHFPQDMGFNTEETGPKLRFLSTWLEIADDSLVVQPYQPNIQFVLGYDTVPKVSRCPLFYNHVQTPSRMLRSFIFAQVFSYDRLCELLPLLAYKHISILCIECWKSRWELKQIARCLLSRSLRYRSCFLDLCVRIGMHVYKTQSIAFLVKYAHMPVAEILAASKS